MTMPTEETVFPAMASQMLDLPESAFIISAASAPVKDPQTSDLTRAKCAINPNWEGVSLRQYLPFPRSLSLSLIDPVHTLKLGKIQELMMASGWSVLSFLSINLSLSLLFCQSTLTLLIAIKQ